MNIICTYITLVSNETSALFYFFATNYKNNDILSSRVIVKFLSFDRLNGC